MIDFKSSFSIVFHLFTIIFSVLGAEVSGQQKQNN